eukprot:1248166-Amphidinium_carterae.1
MIKKWWLHHSKITGGPPLEKHEPRIEMVSAMHSRVVVHKLEPWRLLAVNSIWPKDAKVLRHLSWMPQKDGAFQTINAPGPSDFTTWAACLKVHAAVLYMLRFEGSNGLHQLVVKPSSVERYFESFPQFALQNFVVWHQAVEAEDRARSELFPRLKGRLEHAVDAGPWDAVFIAAPRTKSFEYSNNRGQKRMVVSSTFACIWIQEGSAWRLPNYG